MSLSVSGSDIENWRSRKYGRISGFGIEQSLSFIDQVYEIRSGLNLSTNPDSFGRMVGYIASIPNWAHYYKYPTMTLLQMAIGAAGVSDIVASAAKDPEPQAAFIDAVNSLPDEGPEPSAAVMSIMFAAMGNAEAIASYSMSIYDMLKLSASRNDPKLIRRAISIDAYVLTLPLVISQLRIGQLIGNMEGPEFFTSGLRGPDKRRDVYTKLRMVEYLLREMGAFDSCSEREIHELVVDHLGLYDDDTRLGDSKKALFALFRKWQKSAGN